MLHVHYYVELPSPNLSRPLHNRAFFLRFFPTLNRDNGIVCFVAKPATLEDTEWWTLS